MYLQHTTASQAPSVAWDAAVGGYRAYLGELQTPAYITPAAALRAVERGELAPCPVTAPGGPAVERSQPGAAQGCALPSALAPPGERAAGLPRQPGAAGGGLSLNNKVQGAGAVAPASAAQAAPVNPARVKRLKEAGKDERSRPWYVTLTNGEKRTVVNSQETRVKRCRVRVRSWADTLPKLNRRWRRVLKRKNLGPRTVMVTLTYREVDSWRPNHIREFMKALRALLGSNLWGYAWVIEVQQRGAPHYHVMLHTAPGVAIPQPDSSGLWPHGSSRIETARKGPWYLVKYTGKAYQKEQLPKGARMFAVQVYKTAATPDELFGFRLSAAPRWLQPFIEEARQEVGPTVRWMRYPGGGWLIKETGERHESGWWVEEISRDPPQESG